MRDMKRRREEPVFGQRSELAAADLCLDSALLATTTHWRHAAVSGRRDPVADGAAVGCGAGAAIGRALGKTPQSVFVGAVIGSVIGGLFGASEKRKDDAGK